MEPVIGVHGRNGAGKTTTIECLREKRSTHFSGLPGGRRQRLFIALALVNDPELVFLDEMTADLDPAARHTGWDLVRAVRDAGTTVVLLTHFMKAAERLCDRVAVREVSKILPLTCVTRILEARWPGTALARSDAGVAAGIALAAGVIAAVTFRRELR